MKKLLWILTIVLIFIFSYPTKTKYYSTTNSIFVRSDMMPLQKSYKRDEDGTTPTGITVNKSTIKKDPRHRARRKKGKIIFSNNVLLPTRVKDSVTNGVN